MQVKLFLSLLIWTAVCTQFLSENCLHKCQIAGRFGFGSGFFYIRIRTEFWFSAHPYCLTVWQFTSEIRNQNVSPIWRPATFRATILMHYSKICKRRKICTNRCKICSVTLLMHAYHVTFLQAKYVQDYRPWWIRYSK